MFSSIKKKMDALNKNDEAKFGFYWVEMLLKDKKELIDHNYYYLLQGSRVPFVL